MYRVYVLLLVLSVFVNELLAGLCEATSTAQVTAMLVAPRLFLKN